MKYLLFFLLLPCGLSAGAFPEEAITAYLNRKVLSPDQPGFSVLIVKDGQIVYEKQAGMAHLEKKIAISPDTRFNIGSITKQFTAMCIYLLEEEGKLKTTDSIRKYIPELNPFPQTITIDHLIAHGAGFKEYFEVLNMAMGVKNKVINYESAIAYTNRLHRLTFAPGSDFQYSNTGYMMMALIVERVSGMPIDRYMAEHIFKPLGMNQTMFARDDKPGTSGLTMDYAYNAAKKTFKADTKPSINAFGATGVYSTLRDFSRWDANFDENKLGKKTAALLRRMLTPYPLNDGSSTFYGGGMFLRTYEGVTTEGHSGGWNNYLMQYRRFPEQHLAVMVCCNNNYYSPFAMCDSIANMLLHLPAPPPPLPAAYGSLVPDPEKYTGTYFAAMGIVRQVLYDRGLLYIVTGEGTAAKKQPLRFERKTGDSIMAFTDDKNFEVRFRLRNREVYAFSWGGGGYFANVRYFSKEVPAVSTGKQYTGKYRMDEFGRNVHVRYSKRKHALLVKPVFFKSYQLKPIAEGLYQVKGEDIYIRFERSSMVAANFWVHDIRLRKIKGSARPAGTK